MKQVGLPIDYFRKTAKREYSDWKSALPREFFQNSVDAGATEFRVDFETADDYLVISVKDNGCGMSVQDCEDKLLTMGGSGKNDAHIGGFGVAKGLLFFAWDKWEIRSREFVVNGEGCRYEIVEQQPYVYGVHAKIYINKNEGMTTTRFMDYLALCENYAVHIYINGERFTRRRHKGRMLKEMTWATLHKLKTQNHQKVRSAYIAVRIRGVHMFDYYVNSSLDCQLTLELHGNTRELLTSNRDALREPYRDQLCALAHDISTNIRSSLEEKDEINIQKFTGGSFESIQDDVIETNDEPDEIPNIFDDVVFEKNLVIEAGRATESKPAPFLPTHPATYTNSENQSQIQGFPNIIVKAVGKKLPKKFEPTNWPYKVKTLMKLWLLTLKQVMIDNKQLLAERGLLPVRFGIGIVLDPDRTAEFARDNEAPYFLVNLEWWRSGKKSKTNKPLLPKLNGKNGLMVIRELRQRAAHEITHLVSGKDHDERFITTFEAIEANTWKNENAYRNLLKTVSRRKSKKTIDDNA